MTDTEEDEGYLSRLLLMHPDIDPGADDGPVVTEPAPDPTPDLAPGPIRTAAVPAGMARRSGPVIAYDGDGWISVVPDEPVVPDPPAATERPAVAAPAPVVTAAPPPPAPPAAVAAATPPPWWRRNVSYLAVVLIIAVVVAGMALAPGGERPVLLSGVPTTTKPPSADPLTQQWRLENINLQFSEVERGYVQVFDGAIDPVGTDGCTQPTRADGVVGTAKTAYAYRPDNLDGFAAGHVAAMVTVFRDEKAAKQRAEAERGARYLTCLSRWDDATWFGDTTIRPKSQQMTPVPAGLPGRTVVGARYTATYEGPDGGTYPAYTDHIIVTTGRVRVWLELSSVLYPFNADQRDKIVGNILKRVDKALA